LLFTKGGKFLKLAIVMRTDLGMRKGKLCVQAGHASVEASAHANMDRVTTWYTNGQHKIVLKVKNDDELLGIAANARAAGLEVFEVHDFGLTQIPENSLTCISIGPAPDEEIDPICGKLPLL
jgi:PTH2 family peptidyl-tRNA hydrolase